MKEAHREVLPFTAFVDQRKAKMGLILVAINPDINGILLKGEKGAGKSALVRAFANILPMIEVVKGCQFNCDPNDPAYMCPKCKEKLEEGVIKRKKKKRKIITLPLGSTVDMIAGGLDVEETLGTGEKKFQLGILARANRNILYVDELNLLPDHLVDVILDAMDNKWNYVEREGISLSHPSRFLFIGTMNPEEGGLRPQLLDKIALSVSIHGVKDARKRTEIIERNMKFKKDPSDLFQRYQKKEEKLKKKITKAKEILPEITIPEQFLHGITQICKELQVDGHRPDIVIAETAKAIAAFKERKTVNQKDVGLASDLALGHRTRKKGQLAPPTTSEIKKTFEKVMREVQSKEGMGTPAKEKKVELVGAKPPNKKSKRFKWAFEPYMDYKPTEKKKKVKQAKKKGKSGGNPLRRMRQKAVRMKKNVSKIIGKFTQKLGSIWKKTPSKKMMRTEREKRKQTIPLQGISMKDYSIPHQGRKSRPPEEVKRVPSPRRKNLPSIRGIKGFSSGRRSPIVSKTSQGRVVGYERPKGPIVDIAYGPTIRAAILRDRKSEEMEIKSKDIRVKVRQHRAKAVLSVIFDTSKSMWPYISRVTKGLLKFHDYAWRSKDKVGVLEARGEEARVVLKPTSNRRKIQRAFFRIREGGKTPLASALLKSYKMLTLERRRNNDIIPICVVISDGLGNVELKEEISSELRERIVYPSQADIFAVTRRISLANIPLLVFNPMHLDEWEHPLVISPTKLLKEIARRTNGKYIGFRHEFTQSEQFTSKKIFATLRDGLQTVLQSRAY